MIYEEDLYEASKEIGIEQGELVHVQSDILRIGRISGIDDVKELPNIYLKHLQLMIGDSGLISCYTPYFKFARGGEIFVKEKSPSNAGVLSEHIRTAKGAIRSEHPVGSLTSLGNGALDLTGGIHRDALGYESPWTKLKDKNAWLIGLGLGTNMGSTSFIHYIEQTYGVPYRYTKLFHGTCYDNGVEVDSYYTMNVLYRRLGAKYSTEWFREKLVENKDAKLIKIGSGKIFACRAKIFFEKGINELNRDLHCFLDKTPNYNYNELPCSTI